MVLLYHSIFQLLCLSCWPFSSSQPPIINVPPFTREGCCWWRTWMENVFLFYLLPHHKQVMLIWSAIRSVWPVSIVISWSSHVGWLVDSFLSCVKMVPAEIDFFLETAFPVIKMPPLSKCSRSWLSFRLWLTRISTRAWRSTLSFRGLHRGAAWSSGQHME